MVCGNTAQSVVSRIGDSTLNVVRLRRRLAMYSSGRAWLGHAKGLGHIVKLVFQYVSVASISIRVVYELLRMCARRTTIWCDTMMQLIGLAAM